MSSIMSLQVHHAPEAGKERVEETFLHLSSLHMTLILSEPALPRRFYMTSCGDIVYSTYAIHLRW